MNCCITDLRNKQVISSQTGARLGCVSDVEIDTCSGCVVALIIWGRGKPFGKCDDIRVCWKDIKVIGEDTILVCSCERVQRQKGNWFEGLFK